MEQEDSNFNGIHTIDYCTCVTKAKKKLIILHLIVVVK